MKKMDALSYEILALSKQNKDSFQRFFRRKRFGIVLKSVLDLGIKKGAKILELGCGIGAHSLELASRGFHVTALDINKRFIEYAKSESRRKNLKNVRFLQKDAAKPLNLGKYDLILTSEVIEHIINFRAVFRNIENSLKPDGYLVLTVPNHAGIGELTEFLWGVRTKYNWVEQHYGYCCSVERIEKILDEFNLKPINTYTIFYISHFLPFISGRLAGYVFQKEIKCLSRLNLGTIIVSVSKKVDK